MLTIDLERVEAQEGRRVLDLGCGSGRHAFACMKRGAQVIALDADGEEVRAVAGMIGAMRSAGEVDGASGMSLVGDAFDLPFAPASFDLVIASEILEHLVADEAALAEIARVLRPGGTLAVSVPRAGPERVNWSLSAAYHEVEGGHVRIYRRRSLVAKLERAGFTVVGSHHRHGLHAPYWWLRCLVGVDREDQRLVAAYHRFLVWDIVRRPLLTRTLDALLNPLIGKSLVLYCTRSAR